MHKQSIFKEDTTIKGNTISGNTISEEQQQTQRTRLTQKNNQRSLTTVAIVVGMCMPLVTTLGLLLWVLIKF